MLKDLIEHVVKELVTQPQAISIEMDEPESSLIVFKIHVDDSDRGRVIGKEGKTIKAIRTLANVASLDGKRVNVEIV